MRRFQAAWWLQIFGPWAAGLSVLILIGFLSARSQGWLPPLGWTLLGIGSGYFLLGLLAWLRAGRHFLREEASMVLLESRLGLNNSLTAAAQGITAWPEPPTQVEDGFHFRASWVAGPALLTVACLTLGLLLPVAPADSAASLPPPLALARAEEILNALAKENVANPAALAEARKQLEALLEQPADDYYTHHSLEAADTLEDSLREAAGALGRQLQTAAQAAESLEKYDSALSPEAREQIEGEMKAAVEGLKSGSMGTSEELQKQLAQLDPSELKELDPEQLKKMMENLKAKSAACQECQGKTPGEGQSEAEKALADLLNGKNGKGRGEGEEGSGPGNGGVERGPGAADLTFDKDPKDLTASKLEQLESTDLSRSLPGDHLGTKDIEHQLDQSPSSIGAGGSAATPASGGEAVWRDQLIPSEQKVLRQFFK